MRLQYVLDYVAVLMLAALFGLLARELDFTAQAVANATSIM